MLMVPLEVFSLLVMGSVMTQLRTSTGDAVMDKAMNRVVNRNAENMINGDNTRFRGPLYMWYERDRHIGHTLLAEK